MTVLSERIAELERITRTMTPRDAVPILMAHIAGEAERIARAVADEREVIAQEVQMSADSCRLRSDKQYATFRGDQGREAGQKAVILEGEAKAIRARGSRT